MCSLAPCLDMPVSFVPLLKSFLIGKRFFLLKCFYRVVSKLSRLPTNNSQLPFRFFLTTFLSFWIFSLNSFKRLYAISSAAVAVSKHTHLHTASTVTTRWHFSLTFWSRSYMFPRKTSRPTLSHCLSNPLIHKPKGFVNLVGVMSQCNSYSSYCCIQTSQPH